MNIISRRAFVGAALAGAAALGRSRLAVAAPAQCEPAGLSEFLPDELTVDCGSRQNFHAFRQYSSDLGLTGVVSMTPVVGMTGSFDAGNLFLFPWLKPAGQKLQNKQWPTVVPGNATFYTSTSPIPDATLPLDEYFCRCVLQAPYTSFIGFQVDVPFTDLQTSTTSFTNVKKLADGHGVGIDWGSANLNAPWFRGSQTIPSTNSCNGKAWRTLITNAISQASTGVCYPGPT